MFGKNKNQNTELDTETLLQAITKLSPDDKMRVREALESAKQESADEGVGEPMVEEGGDNKQVQDKVPAQEGGEQAKGEQDEIAEKGQDGQAPTQAQPLEQPQQEQGQARVTTDEDVGNGIPLTAIVTKTDLEERLRAFEAKYDTVLKENDDSKNALQEKIDKYEKGDFGVQTKRGIDAKDPDKLDDFDEYSKQFM